MEKPKLQVVEHKYYNYFEVRDYFESKYPLFHARKVWRELCDSGQIHNGIYYTIEAYKDWLDIDFEDPDPYDYFIYLITEEFGDGDIEFWISW
jgi:hypothetical protein